MVLSKVEEKGMLGYAVMRNRQKLSAEVEDYMRMRDELLKEHCEEVAPGQFKPTHDYFRALHPYSELTVDVPVMQVSPEVFYSGNLTSSQMLVLDWMVKDGD
jgi:hypothetical protein